MIYNKKYFHSISLSRLLIMFAVRTISKHCSLLCSTRVTLLIVAVALLIAMYSNHSMSNLRPNSYWAKLHFPLTPESKNSATNFSNHNQNQFTLFLDIRRACLSVFNVFSSNNSVQYELNYLQISIWFIQKTFLSFDLQPSRKLSLEYRLDRMKEKLAEYLRKNVSSLKVENLFVSEMGSWYSDFRESYLSYSRSYQQQCRVKLEQERRQIVDKIKDLQNGDTCDKSGAVFNFYKDFFEGFPNFVHSFLGKVLF